MTKRLVVAVAIGLMTLAAAPTAGAEPAPPVSPVAPAPPAPAAPGSTDDELADMVLDAIQHQGATPASPAPAPPR